MMSPHDQLVSAKQILSGEFFAPTQENQLVEKALESIDSLVRFRFRSLTLRKRYANERGAQLLKDLRWLLDGDNPGTPHSDALTEFVEALGRSAQDAPGGARSHLRRARPSTAAAKVARVDSPA